jgi:hypothetical protein
MAAEAHDQQHILKEILHSDFEKFNAGIGDGSLQTCIDLLKQTKIYELYQQVINNPLIVEYPPYVDGRFTDVLIYNINLWYFALQLGLASKKIDFTIKGGFSIQLMVDGQYNTTDIDVKVKTKTDAQGLHDLLESLFPDNLPFGYTYNTRFFQDKEQYKVSISRPNGMKTALIDIEYSSPPKNTSQYLENHEQHYRRAQIDGNEEFIFIFSIYPLDDQIGEKSYLLNKYEGYLKKRIDEIKELFKKNEINLDLLLDNPQDKLLVYLNELLKSYKEDYKYEVYDEARKTRMVEVIKNKKDKLEKLLNFKIGYIDHIFASELAQHILYDSTLDGEIINLSYLLFLLSKFNKSYSVLSRKNTSNKWSNQTMKNNSIKSQKNQRNQKNRLKEQLKTLQNQQAQLKRNAQQREASEAERQQMEEEEQSQRKVEAKVERQRREDENRKRKAAAKEERQRREDENRQRKAEQKAAAEEERQRREEQQRQMRTLLNPPKKAQSKKPPPPNTLQPPPPPPITQSKKQKPRPTSARRNNTINKNSLQLPHPSNRTNRPNSATRNKTINNKSLQLLPPPNKSMSQSFRNSLGRVGKSVSNKLKHTITESPLFPHYTLPLPPS